jgi:hypothetical protein
MIRRPAARHISEDKMSANLRDGRPLIGEFTLRRKRHVLAKTNDRVSDRRGKG